MIRNIGKNGAILAAFAILTTLLIVLTSLATDSTITQQQQSKLRQTLNTVIPANLHENDIAANCVIVTDAQLLGPSANRRIYRASVNGEYVAMAIEATAPDGYSGDIDLLVGTRLDGTVTGVRVLSHRETPGLGDKIDASISDWILAFNGKRYSDESRSRWAVKKDGGQFDQFTGATITPRAVVSAVARAVQFGQQNQSELLQAENNCALDTDHEDNAHAQ
ncbi:electron transport complex subunit RsxG [Aestuariibacter salexigens]|uniref:electron transport complex subunit RsxG n=1 Tax=Aestuariibacter salexigens TaxID=226010 RepID=UPI00041F5B01|nr:electron transport complex subunit RsxG [Aestuariibacter salexigens]